MEGGVTAGRCRTGGAEYRPARQLDGVEEEGQSTGRCDNWTVKKRAGSVQASKTAGRSILKPFSISSLRFGVGTSAFVGR